jgi:hypothetical protein
MPKTRARTRSLRKTIQTIRATIRARALPAQRRLAAERHSGTSDTMKRSTAAMFELAIQAEHAWQEHAGGLSDKAKRKLFREFHERRQRAIDEERIYVPDRPTYLHNLTCGARRQSGGPCQMTALFANGRCIWHGGKSTGPSTPDGKVTALANLDLGRLKRGKSRY